jgi:hypothetical protein
MAQYHLLRCMVALGGDNGNTVYRHRGRPIVFPELPILQFLHGGEAVTEVYVVGTWETNNAEVLARLDQIYTPEIVREVYPGARPNLPLSDSSVPFCTLPVHVPKPTRPDSPDPKLRPLDQFTITRHMPVIESDPPEPDDEPTPDEIAAHAQDEIDEAQDTTATLADDMGLGVLDPGAGPDVVRPVVDVADVPHVVRDTHGRGSSRSARPGRHDPNLPDVNAGMSHRAG